MRLQMSRAGGCVRDAELSLRPVELGGFEDGVFQAGSTNQLHMTGQLPLRLLRSLALRDIWFTRTVATLGSSLEPYVGNR